jgi:putative DNA primase/helicase
MRYDGRRWSKESTLLAFDLARRLCRELTRESNSKQGEAKSVLSAKTVAAVERIARADRRMAATIDQWDTGPFLLNTPDGTVDLKTGAMRPHRLEDYMTKMTAVSPGGDHPMWDKFLVEFTSKDEELQEYLKRACGYCLTGDTREEALLFLFGTGGNGKGVFSHTISGIVGDYHRSAPMEVFTASKLDRHPTELAMLQGARLVTATETEEGKRWDESRIKTLTGRDPIEARFMRQDFFECGNHRPGLRSVDEAIRRRINLIKCSAAIPKDKRDPLLAEKLKSVWSGILSWMIEGCQEWQRVGLKPPAAVTSATDDYLESEDAFGSWLEECCVTDANETETSEKLWNSWKQWAERSGEFIGSQRRFGQKLEDRGFVRIKERQKRGYRGLSVPL